MAAVPVVPGVREAGGPVLSRAARRGAQGLSDRALAWWFVGPTLVLLLAFNIFPLLWTVFLSFTNYRANRPNAELAWLGIANYRRVLGDEAMWEHMRATAHFLCWSIALQLLLGFVLALLLNRRFRTHSFWSTAILLPMMLAPAVVGTFWKYFFEPQYGIFNRFVELFGGAGNLTMLGDTTLSPWAIVLVDTWMWTPYVMLLLLAGLRSIPAYLYEAAEIDRASEWFKFRRITFPLVWPLLLIAVMFRAIEAFRLFDLVYILTGGGPGGTTETLSYNVYKVAFFGFDTGRASAYGILMVIVVTIAAQFYLRYLNKLQER